MPACFCAKKLAQAWLSLTCSDRASVHPSAACSFAVGLYNLRGERRHHRQPDPQRAKASMRANNKKPSSSCRISQMRHGDEGHRRSPRYHPDCHRVAPPRRSNAGLSMIRCGVRISPDVLALHHPGWDVRRFLPSVAHGRVRRCLTILSFHSVSGRCWEEGGYWSHSARATRHSVVLRETITHDVKCCQTEKRSSKRAGG